ncbi:Immunity protein 51 [Pedobacter steynii]|uniref:Immunity protein 51 n=1 Tax=Pedobacter steynii TaxID=430522 RepID=A0A1H0ASJ9_9SPHI|nr:hypothetical protein [Pedobacter steynii]NQX41276.1 hypothetical protein [Pedobacter steynii]SDN36335.1 Immunity protein 51 [Pedobacter steynii]
MLINKIDFCTLNLPSDLHRILEEEGEWESEEFLPFFINVDLVEGESEDGDLLFSFQFSPSSQEFERLNSIVSSKGFDENGYGWTEFLMNEIEKLDQDLVGDLEVDPEAETCSIVTTSRGSFEKLLFYLTKVFQELIR